MPQQLPYLVSADSVLDSIESGQFSIAGWFEVNNYFLPFIPFTFWAGPAWEVGLNANGTLSFQIQAASGTIVTTTSSINEGWNFVAAIYDPVAMVIQIWLNGVATSTTLNADAAYMTPFVPGFQLGVSGVSVGAPRSPFSLDQTGVWGRVLTALDIAELYNGGLGNAYPFVGGPFSLIFQANLINTFEPTPLVLCSQSEVFSVGESVSTDANNDTQYGAFLNTIYQGITASQGFHWTADNFSDKVLIAQHDNQPLYWTPPSTVALPLPGLPAGQNYDGVCVFQNHVMLWYTDNLIWSDVNDFTDFIPVATTAVSAVLNISAPFTQPQPGGSVLVTVSNPQASVSSLSLSGNLTFGTVNINQTSEAVLNVINTGNVPITVTGLTFPVGVDGNSPVFTAPNQAFPFIVQPGLTVPVVISFIPTESISYDGIVTVASNATTGTSIFPISGAGTGQTFTIALSGNLTFSDVPVYTNPHSLTSTLVIENFGNTAFNVTGLQFPAGITAFTTTTNFGTSGITVPAASALGTPGFLLVPIKFTATVVTTYAGQIKVLCNPAPTAGSVFINVSGTGVTAASIIEPVVFITDNGTVTENFDNISVGASPTATITVFNVGSSPISIASVTAPAPAFSASFTGAIAGFGSTTFNVTFDPAAAGGFSGDLLITFLTPGHPNGVVGSGGTNQLTYPLEGTAIATGASIVLGGDLNFGDVNFGSSLESFLTIQNIGTSIASYSSISVPAGFAASSSGSVAAGQTVFIPVTFAPTGGGTNPIPFAGNLTVNFASGVAGVNTILAQGVGTPVATAAALVAGQVVSLIDSSQPGQSYYNYYTVVSDSAGASGLSLTLMNLTGITPAGSTIGVSGQQFFTVDANEAGATVIAGSRMNGTIFRILPQGDYAYSFKERSIQSIQYTGLGNGIFFIHNEISGEGLIGRNALCDCNDGRMIFLGHKELYLYQGGPNLQPICQQFTRQLYKELDYARLYEILPFHNENRKEIWVPYPTKGGGFKVLIWNYVEDSASIDTYETSQQFTALGFADWSNSVAWAQLGGGTESWTQLGSVTWDGLNSGDIDHLPLIAFEDGSIVAHGQVYSRDGAGYVSLSESMDYDFQNPDIFKYTDVIVLGLQVLPGTLTPVTTYTTLPGPSNAPVLPSGVATMSGPPLMYVQIGTVPALGASGVVWSNPVAVATDGSATAPVKVNPGGSGRYLRVRFMSQDPGVQWRVSFFEIHCRPGGFY